MSQRNGKKRQIAFDEDRIRSALSSSWSPQTAIQWRPDNPALGQCNVTALLVNELFGGRILKTRHLESVHYYNEIDGQRYDFTSSQFTSWIEYDDELPTRAEIERGVTRDEMNTLRNAFRTFYSWQMMKGPRQDDEELRSDSRTRLIEAPREAVFAAFSNPEQLARWWGPEGFSSRFEEFDLRAGGYWRFTMQGPDGTDYPNESRFLEVDENRRVVVEHFSGHHFILTITLTPTGRSTQIGWRQVFDSAEHYEQIAEFISRANEQNLDRLQAMVEGRG